MVLIQRRMSVDATSWHVTLCKCHVPAGTALERAEVKTTWVGGRNFIHFTGAKSLIGVQKKW